MTFYRDFCQNRLKNAEEYLSAAAEIFSVEDDSEIDAEMALTQLAGVTANAELAKTMLATMAASAVYKIGQTYLTIDAADRVDYQEEGEGIASGVDADVDGAFVSHNPAPIGIGHGYTHPACPRLVARVPIKNMHRLGPPGLFNGCLLRTNNGALFSCRTKGFPSRTFIYQPERDLTFCDPKELKVPSSFEYCSAEDVRMFTHEGKTLVSFTLAGQTDKGWLCRMLLGELNEKREMTWVHAMESPTNSPVEKNWVYFSNEGRLFCVYYPSPHVVHEVENITTRPVLGTQWEADNWQHADFMENARGGAPPVKLGDEFYHFYHTQHRHGRGVSYQVGLYTFEDKPPWNIARIIKGPILSVVPSKRDVDVVFPCGADLREGMWTLSCGVQDHETFAICLEFEDLERLLVKV